MNSEKLKDKIIEITTELIEQCEGDIKKITSRLIAEKANIGLGSINYFFGSKENLITLCVQRVISKMLFSFKAEITDFDKKDDFTDKERLICWATQTFEFLYENKTIANISILNDMNNYSANCNSVYTQKGFMFAMRKNENESSKKLLTFILVSTMQAALLARDSAKEFLGYDLSSQQERNLFIENVVNMLFNEIKSSEDDSVN